MTFNFDILQQSYQRDHWKDLIRTLFPSESDLFASPVTFDLGSDRIESFVQFGNIELNDRYNSRLALFEVRLKPGTTKLQINRVALREIAEKMRKNTAITGAFAVFADEATGKWRFTFIAKAAVFGEKAVETADPKRYTYMLGKGETTRTAELRFSGLAGIVNKRLEDILEAFSVEKINKEFFDQYKKQYETCWQYLAQPDSIAYPVFKINPKLVDDKTRKPLRDFAKRLMGRLVFLYFLQKKGWMGCPANTISWQGGDTDFTANLFRNLPAAEQAHFYSKQLTRLFFNTLNERREQDLFVMPDGSQVRVPYLNGGLFDGDVPGTEQFDFPAAWFTQLFEFFGQYNFTIDESSPNDHEIGIDPEMLGHIFENLLEENREKGAYYTPKEIVHYMCQESLLLYLKERLGLSSQSANVSQNESDTPLNIISSDSREADEQELEQFVRHKKRGEKAGFIYKNARVLEKLLKTVRICDPAIGSGAFPMGLLYEIFHCQVELDLTEHFAELKKDIIHHCIYGVDKDKGAVDIARLRFWLALVVDEEVPQPLPNLDYKIMQGDSLLERFEGIDLTNLLGENGNGNGNGTTTKTAPMLFEAVQEPTVQFGDKDKVKLSRWLDQFFEPQSAAQKAELKGKIDRLINTELNEAIRRYKVNLLLESEDLKKAYGQVSTKQQKEIARLEAEITACENKQERLAWWQERDEKPFFLWHTWFRDVFDRGGFDIVIGNPPYVRQEAIGALKDDLAQLYPITFKGTADLLVYFVELSYSKLLRSGGQFAFIINNKWIRSGYGEGLRKLLQRTSVHQLLDFGDLPVFESAMAYPCILMFEKNQTKSTFDVVLFEDVPFKHNKTILEEVNRLKFPIKVENLDFKQWHLHLPVEDLILERIKLKSIVLDEYIERQAFYGIKTGATEVFVRDQYYYAEYVVNENEIKQIKPMLMGRNLKKYEVPISDKLLIRFEKGITNRLRGASSPQNWLEKNYPVLLNDLSEFEEKAKARSDKGDYWWELRACEYYDLFEKPKIMYQKFQVSPCFVYDEDGLYCNDSMWFIPRDDKFLLGYLNSQMGWWCITMYCSRISGGFQLMYEYLKNIPIPIASDKVKAYITRLVEMVIYLKKQEGSAEQRLMSDYFERLIDVAFYEIYFEEEMKAKECDIIRHFGGLLEITINETALTQIEDCFKKLYERSHPVRVALFNLSLVEPVSTIINSINRIH